MAVHKLQNSNQGDEGLPWYCICLVGIKKGANRTMINVKTKEDVWHQNKDYVGGSTC